MKNILLLSTAGLMALSACSQDADPGERGTLGPRALAGAAIGAAAGLASGKLTEDAIIARTVAGAAAGGLIGAQLDKQERELREDLGGSGALITNTGSSLIVTLPEAITFDTNSTAVRPSLQNSLVSLAANLNQYPDTGVDVFGHTDNVGSTAFNQDLSRRRAEAVSSVLMSSGVIPSRIRSIGRGETSPIASNDSSTGRAQNRRVEIVITPRT